MPSGGQGSALASGRQNASHPCWGGPFPIVSIKLILHQGRRLPERLRQYPLRSILDHQRPSFAGSRAGRPGGFQVRYAWQWRPSFCFMYVMRRRSLLRQCLSLWRVWAEPASIPDWLRQRSGGREKGLLRPPAVFSPTAYAARMTHAFYPPYARRYGSHAPKHRPEDA